MKALRVIYHLTIADFLERARRYSFLLTLAAVIGVGVLVNNGTLGMSLGSSVHGEALIRYIGELNSAWVGTMTVMIINGFLGLLGFYLVSDSIKRDVHTGVGQIIATTPVSRAVYLVGKWISNCLVLFVLVLILAVAAVVMVLLQGKAALDLGALLMPFLAVALPNMALTAALAVVFETVPWLRGAVGNAVYFFLWIATLIMWNTGGIDLPFKDPIGYRIFGTSINAAARVAYPNAAITPGLSIGGANIEGAQFNIFNWNGLDWTPGIVAEQWVWSFIGLGLILLSAAWFARFDPSREGLRLPRPKPEAKEGEPVEPRKKAPRITLPTLSPLVSRLAQINPFLGVLFAELRLLLNGRRWWWWAITAGLSIAILTSPLSIVQDYLLPVIWLWPMSIWSGMGNRERKHNTAQMVFSSSRPVLRQLPAAWLAGILATALLVMAAAVVFLSTGNLPALAGWLGGVIFVPALALALGVFSSGSRVFEVIYLIWWYIGPIQKIAGLDFTAGAPQFYLLAAAGLLLLAVFWRGKQVRV